MLFSIDSILAMVHGIALGGGAMMGLAALLFALLFMDSPSGSEVSARQSRAVAILAALAAVLVWLTVIGGTYLVFPPYRVAPPDGVVDLAQYPRYFLLDSPETAWLHAYAMETKEHVPWIAAMLATAVAFVGRRNRSTLLSDPQVRKTLTTLTAISLALTAYVALLGTFVNKVAPL